MGGPEDKERLDRETRGGDDDVVGNVRQGGVRRDGAVRNSWGGSTEKFGMN